MPGDIEYISEIQNFPSQENRGYRFLLEKLSRFRGKVFMEIDM